MNSEELAFVNHQLSSMVSSGIPLEGALRDVVRNLKSPSMRAACGKLAERLESGQKLNEALEGLGFPVVYRRLLAAGSASGRLQNGLSAAADYYQSQTLTMHQLRAILLYPLVTLLLLLGVSVIVGLTVTLLYNEMVMNPFTADMSGTPYYTLGRPFTGPMEAPSFFHFMRADPVLFVSVWWVPVAIGLLLITAVCLIGNHRFRDWAGWRIPGFRDANLSLTASQLASIHRNGTSWPDTVSLVAGLHKGTPAGEELEMWYASLEQGKVRPEAVMGIKGPIPRLFRWVVAAGGENLLDSLDHLTSLYRERAKYYHDLVIQVISPALILCAAVFIVFQSYPVVSILTRSLNGIAGF
jgi:type II secretory pathway component PulF